MTKTQSKKMNQLKYLLLIPVLASMLFYTSCAGKEKTTKTEEVIEIEEVKEVEKVKEKENSTTVSEEESIAFASIDKAPTFPGCSEGDKDCFHSKIQKHFASKFNADLPNTLGLSPDKNRMVMLFNIDKEGAVSDIRVKAAHKDLEKEATRVLKMLPTMTPGEHNGKPTNVKYSLPIRIDIE
jgi:hypothetical protein